MKNWTEGYNSDSNYTIGHFKELNPEYLNMCAVLAEVNPIPIEESFSYCELGCGYGLSTLINAANYPQGTFYALDYNPSQIAYARKMAKDAGLNNIHFIEASFQDAVDNPTLLPKFDFIVFHGIYAWVSEENRANLVKISGNHIKSGGMVYNSYNAKPGWSTIEIIQKLMHGLSQEQIGSSSDKIDSLIKYVDKITNMNDGFIRNQNKELKRHIEQIKSKNKTYVAHEYINDGWRAFFFPEVSQEMQKAKLDYLCLAFLSENISKQLQTESLNHILKDVKSIENRELIKDLSLNTRFRKDIYTRGDYGELTKEGQYNWFKNIRWISLVSKKVKKYSFSFVSGSGETARDPFDTILAHLKKNNLTTIELQKISHVNNDKIIDSLVLLYNDGFIAPYKRINKQAQKLNSVIANKAFNKVNITKICYPNANIGYPVGMVSLLWLKAINDGFSRSKEMIDYTYNYFRQNKQELNIKGKHLKGEKLKEYLVTQEKEWRTHILPIWINVGVVSLHKPLAKNNK